MSNIFLIVGVLAFYSIGIGFMYGAFKAVFYNTDYIEDIDSVDFMAIFWPIGLFYLVGRMLSELVFKKGE